MLKTLEKYKKYVLVIGGSMLMVAFLMPTAISQVAGDPRKRVAAYLGKEKVLEGDLAIAHREFSAVQRIAPLLATNLRLRDDLHWFLMTTDAQRAGMIGAETDGEMFLRDMTELVVLQIAQARYRQMAEFMLQQPEARRQLFEEAERALPNMALAARRETGLGELEFYRAMAKLRGVLRLQSAFMQAGRLSDRRLQAASRNLQEFARVDAVVIPATRLADRIEDPTEEQLEEHFARFRDVKPGSGENGIGYLQPDRLKVAWLFVDHLAVSDSVRIDPVEANKRWRKEYPTRSPDEFAKDRPAIEAAMRAEKVTAIMAQIDKIWRAQVMASIRRLEPDGPYKRLPEDWDRTRPSLESMAIGIMDGVRAAAEVSIPMPAVVIRDATWMAARDIEKIPGIGRSMVTVANRTIPAWEVLFSVRELLPAATQTPPAGVPIQVGVPIADLHATDASQNRYYFVVLDARPSSPPESLHEVRDQVVRGFKALRAFDLLKGEGSTLESLAAAEGVEAVDAAFAVTEEIDPTSDAPRLYHDLLVAKTEVGGNDPRLKTDSFRDAVWMKAGVIDPLKPITSVPVENRTFHVELPGSLALAVCQISGYEPLTIERYRMIGEQLVRNEQVRELSKTFSANSAGPFSIPSLTERLGFRMIRRDSESDPETTSEPEAPAGASR